MSRTPAPSDSLFSDVARATDPATSHAAGVRVTQDGTRARQAREVAEAVRETPGHTSAEIAGIHGLDRYAVARRMTDVERAGLVSRGAPKKCDCSGRFAVTWWPVEVTA